jgi:hypothetical protein
LTWQRGRIVENPFSDGLEFGPNLDMIPKVNDTYLKMYDEEKDLAQRDSIVKAHRNFLRQAIYSLYVYNRTAEAAKWFKYLGQKYPDKTIIDGDFNSYPRNVTLDQYAVACVQSDINDMSPDRLRTVLEGLLMTSYMSLVIDQDDRAEGLKRLAQQAWQSYQSKIPVERRDPLKVPPVREISRDVLGRLLNPTNGLPPQAQAVLRTKLNLPAEKAPLGATNQVEMETRGTNAP